MDSKTTEQLDKIETTISEIQELMRDINTQVNEMIVELGKYNNDAKQ